RQHYPARGRPPCLERGALPPRLLDHHHDADRRAAEIGNLAARVFAEDQPAMAVDLIEDQRLGLTPPVDLAAAARDQIAAGIEADRHRREQLRDPGKVAFRYPRRRVRTGEAL